MDAARQDVAAGGAVTRDLELLLRCPALPSDVQRRIGAERAWARAAAEIDGLLVRLGSGDRVESETG
jgi:hypothetical protein